MANFLDNIKRITGFEPEDDFDDYDIDLEEEYEEDEAEDVAPVRQAAPAAEAKGQQRRNNVVNMPSKTTLQVVLAKPERFDDASAIADHLNEKRTVVLNLEAANRDVSRRLIDFLSGVAYANAGQLKRVANSTFIITPFNVSVTGDLLDELENSGVFFTGQQ